LKVEDCTKDKLNELCHENTGFQSLFAKAIESINGSSNKLAPDLVDKLSGIERVQPSEKNDKNTKKYPSLSEKTNPLLDDWTHTTEAGKNFVAEYHEEGILQMKKGIMTFFDNVNIGAMLNDQGKLLSLGIDKSWDINKRQHELENSFLKTLLGALSVVTFEPLTLSLGMKFGQTGASEDLKKLRARNVDVSNLI